MALRRMWVNQPSTLQPEHKLHGTIVLAQEELHSTITMRVWFLSGDVVSRQMLKMCLSEGWPDHLK